MINVLVVKVVTNPGLVVCLSWNRFNQNFLDGDERFLSVLDSLVDVCQIVFWILVKNLSEVIVFSEESSNWVAEL